MLKADREELQELTLDLGPNLTHQQQQQRRRQRAPNPARHSPPFASSCCWFNSSEPPQPLSVCEHKSLRSQRWHVSVSCPAAGSTLDSQRRFRENHALSRDNSAWSSPRSFRCEDDLYITQPMQLLFQCSWVVPVCTFKNVICTIYYMFNRLLLYQHLQLGCNNHDYKADLVNWIRWVELYVCRQECVLFFK